MTAERRLQAEGFLHEGRDQLWVLAQLLLKVLVLGQEAHGVAEQAGGGLTSGAQQRVQDVDPLLIAERTGVDAACDGAEDVVVWLLYRGRELIGDPGLDLADARDQLVQIVEGQHGPQRRRRVERGAQEKVQVTPTKADQAADHRDRHDVPDLGHEIDVPIAQRSLHAPHRNLCDLGLERSHAPGTNSGKTVFLCTA